MTPNLNKPPTIILIQGAQGPFNLIFANQFKWTPNNNIDPGGPSPSIWFLPTNLNGPLQQYLVTWLPIHLSPQQ